VHECFPRRTTGDGASDRIFFASPASPFRNIGNRISVGIKSLKDETPVLSDGSDTEDEAGAISSIVDPDAAIHPYLKWDFETYDQGEITEEVTPDGDADAKELEVVGAPEDDAQSATGEEVPENLKSSQPIETSEKSEKLETGIPDPEPAALDTPIVLGSPSPSKQSKLKAIAGLAGASKKIRFPKFTPVESFENYLQNSAEMDYNVLYHKTAKVADALIAYQNEFDAVDQEIIEYEAIIKAEAKRAVEDAKEEADRILELEDLARDEVQEKYRDKLGMRQKDWQNFLKGLASRRSCNVETLKHLNNLRNPQFVEAAKKRRNRTAPRAAKKLQDEPVPEYKLTKEEHDFEKRKLGRLLDPIKFEDQKMADVYGFEYSSHPSHHGNQPLEKMVRQTQKFQRKIRDVNGSSENTIGSPQTGRLRVQRTKSKRLYDVDDSGTSEGEEEMPVKRARRPKIFEDGAPANPISNAQNLGLIPAAKRTFPSGKRVGRPPKAYSQSKLQAVQTVQESPDIPAEIHGEQFRDNAAQPGPSGIVEVPVVKRKHPGGRPRKNPARAETTPMETPRPKNKGGRPRNYPVQETTPQDGTVRVSTSKAEPSSTGNMVQLGDADDVIQSTEVDEASRGNSPVTSRPSTSSSSESASSFAARRSARASTRTKTITRELRARSADEYTMGQVDNPSSSSSSSSRDKRKRGTADTEPSPIVVDAPVQFDEPAPKRRRTKTSKAEGDGLEDLASQMGPKRKRKRAATQGESVAKKAKKSMRDSADGEDDEEDEDPLSPLARKEIGKKVQSEKSKKLSISTKARWASGGMQKAQETRRANLAIKKAAKEAATAAAAAAAAAAAVTPVTATAATAATPETSNAFPAQLTTPVPSAAEPESGLPKQQRAQRQRSPVDGGRPPSTRVKRPTRIAAGLDGIIDDYDDELDGFPSEYDRYQALTSASSPGLGKRVRRPLVDLSAMMGETSDEDYY
jgi:hypothetical protein